MPSHLEPGCLAVKVGTRLCERRKLLQAPTTDGARGCDLLGRVMTVVGPTKQCGCCVLVEADWLLPPSGVVTHRANLRRIDGYDELDDECVHPGWREVHS